MNRLTLIGLVLLGILFGAGGMALANRVAPGELGTADRTRVEQVVRDYVLSNPELIPQAMQKLQEREAARAVSASRGKIEEPYKGAWIGNPKGDVTLVEFYDYNCGYCRASLPTLERLVASDPNLRVVFKELPVLSDESRVAARAALAAAAQGKFKRFHDALYAGGRVSEASIAAAARTAGVNLSAIPGDADQVIRDNMEIAARLGITGTPTWVVGDQLLTGAQPFERLREAVAKARASSARSVARLHGGAAPPRSARDKGTQMPEPILTVAGVSKTYRNGPNALKTVDLSVNRGEIFALLGPNGAGKTTLISIICGIVTPSSGSVTVAGHDTQRDYKAARRAIGLVPQELSTDQFESVLATVTFSRRLFGRSGHADYIEQVLRDLSLWDKRHSKIKDLSGGMKRRVLIAKALAHEPQILFLDEPTAGVDVSLRRDMWKLVHRLREQGATIILTTHYIEEAEEMADRVGVITGGELLLVEEKTALMAKLGKRQMDLTLATPLEQVPDGLDGWDISLADEGHKLRYTFDAKAEDTGIPALLERLTALGIPFRDLETSKSSLEDIFVGLVEEKRA